MADDTEISARAFDEAIRRGNPVVFFDITIGGVPSGRIKMELFRDVVPRVKYCMFFFLKI